MTRQASDEVIPGIAAVSVGDPGTEPPEGWTRVRLTDVARLESGHTPSRKHPEWWGGDVPWVSLPDAREHHGGVIEDTTQKTNKQGLANSAARLLPKDTVCLSRTASVGYVFRLGRPMATSQDFVNWVCSEALDPRFLMQALIAEGDHLLNFGKGTTHTTIYFPEVLAFHLNLAPLPEQRRIVAKVDALLAQVNAARERLAKVPLILKRFRQAVLAAACSGKLTEDWRDAHPDETGALPARPQAPATRRGRRGANLSAEGELLLDSMPEVPNSWSYRRADEVVAPGTVVTYGIVLPGPEIPHGVPYIRQQDIQDNGTICLDHLRHTTREIAAKHGRSSLRADDVLLCIIRNLRAAVVPSGIDGANITQGTVRLRCANFIRPAYLAAYLESPHAQAWMKERYFGMDMPRINVEDARAIPIAVPPLREQDEVLRRMGNLLSLSCDAARRLEEVSAQARVLKQAILSKAFSGDLVTTEADLARTEGRDYEPASVLIERLREAGNLPTKVATKRSRPGRSPARPHVHDQRPPVQPQLIGERSSRFR